MIDAKKRVMIWNTFFKLAWEQAKRLNDTGSQKKSKKKFKPLGGPLPDGKFYRLATLALCCLAVEARANHLLDELVEEGKISKKENEAAQRLPTKYKWFLLPKLAGVNQKLDETKQPHRSIVEICRFRNSLMHVSYNSLQKKLPKKTTMLSLFEEFVKAMENMNVVLGRIKKERKKVLDIGKF